MDLSEFYDELEEFTEQHEPHGLDPESLAYSRGYYDALLYVLEWMEEYT